MGLKQELADYRAEFVRTAPAGRDALYSAKVEELRRGFPIGNALATGDEAPDFTLPDARGGLLSLREAVRGGAAIVIFYRGGWCPYCNIQLRSFQRALPEISALGGRLLAISPQLPDGSLSTVEKNELAFDVLSDAGNQVARAFGLVYSLPEELRQVMQANGKALPGINGDDSWELPLPAVYLIDGDRRVVLGKAELDYRDRFGPEDVLPALRLIRTASAQAG